MGIEDCFKKLRVPQDVRDEVMALGGDITAVQQLLNASREGLRQVATDVGINVPKLVLEQAATPDIEAGLASLLPRTLEQKASKKSDRLVSLHNLSLDNLESHCTKGGSY